MLFNALGFALNNQFGFQTAATPFMEGIIDLHHNLFFFMILIFTFVFWTIINCIFYFVTAEKFIIFYEKHLYNPFAGIVNGSHYYTLESPLVSDLIIKFFNIKNSIIKNILVKLFNFDSDVTSWAKFKNRSLFLRFNHGTVIEFVWTIAPCLILAIIAVQSFNLLYSAEDVTNAYICIKVIGHQWYWTYEYSYDYDTIAPKGNNNEGPSNNEHLVHPFFYFYSDFFNNYQSVEAFFEFIDNVDYLSWLRIYYYRDPVRAAASTVLQFFSSMEDFELPFDYFSLFFDEGQAGDLACTFFFLTGLFVAPFTALELTYDIEGIDNSFFIKSAFAISCFLNDYNWRTTDEMFDFFHHFMYDRAIYEDVIYEYICEKRTIIPRSDIEIWAYFKDIFNLDSTHKAINSDIHIIKHVNITSYMVPTDDLNTGDLRLLECDKVLYVPAHVHINFYVTAVDVLHSWAIPSLGVKMDAIPGRLNMISTYIARTGVYYGQCSEICGINHGFMPIVLIAYEV
jgi:heme/copper-type cytochrome/quinol oxidase subunit 2